MKNITFFCLLLGFFIVQQNASFSRPLSTTGKRIAASQDIALECASVQDFFRSMDERAQTLLNTVLRKNYAAGYYSAMLQFSDAAHYDELQTALLESEKRLHTLKGGEAYRSLLRQAKGGMKHHLIRFIVGRREAGAIHGRSVALRKWVHGTSPALAVKLDVHDAIYSWGTLFFGELYTAPVRGHRYYIEAKDVFSPPVSTVSTPTPSRSRTFELDLGHVDAATMSRMLLAVFLYSIAILAVIGLIGVCCFPRSGAFAKMRLLLEH